MQFNQLIKIIQSTHEQTQRYAIQQVNQSLTIRNWMVGCYLVEYEQNGEDRAAYGAKLLVKIAEGLKNTGIKGLDDRSLRACRSFYECYPQIWRTLSAKFQYADNEDNKIWGTVSAKLESGFQNIQTVPEQSFAAEILISHLSFSHFLELMNAETPLKKAFYEVQAIKNNWSVRELSRAMSTLLFERTGLSTNKKAVIAKARDKAPTMPSDVIKNPYFLEFLGLEEKSEYSETDLEQAIITHLQKFLVELGRGFCFEARQKRITIGNTPYRIDLVFYHRILKCHVLFDLKIGAFDHGDAGQMNAYLNYYKENEMTTGDNQPVGVILCAQKDDALVHYATGGLSQEVFVSKYLIGLPSVDELKKLIEADTRKFEEDNDR
jgi:predicted nuclease of restriction endonuclease-like (RecB) superfamily